MCDTLLCIGQCLGGTALIIVGSILLLVGVFDHGDGTITTSIIMAGGYALFLGGSFCTCSSYRGNYNQENTFRLCGVLHLFIIGILLIILGYEYSQSGNADSDNTLIIVILEIIGAFALIFSGCYCVYKKYSDEMEDFDPFPDRYTNNNDYQHVTNINVKIFN
eukprot:354157_1